MSDERRENDHTILYLLAIFIGLYIFFFGFIRRWATSTITVFFGGLAVFFMEVTGAAVAYDQLEKGRPGLVGVYPLFYFFCGLYLLLVIKAFREDRAFRRYLDS